MKKLGLSLLSCLLLVAFTNTSRAWHVEGFVVCDANGNSTIDAGDLPIPGVLVVVTNTSGTFSNTAWTQTDGSYFILMPHDPDTYVQILHPATVPSGSSFVIPATGVYQFTLGGVEDTFAGNWLLSNPNCLDTPPGACWMTGGGTIGGTGKKPDHNFGGNVFPSCSAKPGKGGNWNHIAQSLNLHFKGTVVETVACGNVSGIPDGSTSPVTPFNYIEFTGYGSLKGVGGNKTKYNLVYFTARVEDRSEPGKNSDHYYLRVYTPDGTTRLLVSGDTANPENVVPVPISGGNLQLHASSCD